MHEESHEAAQHRGDAPEVDRKHLQEPEVADLLTLGDAERGDLVQIIRLPRKVLDTADHVHQLFQKLQALVGGHQIAFLCCLRELRHPRVQKDDAHANGQAYGTGGPERDEEHDEPARYTADGARKQARPLEILHDTGDVVSQEVRWVPSGVRSSRRGLFHHQGRQEREKNNAEAVCEYVLRPNREQSVEKDHAAEQGHETHNCPRVQAPLFDALHSDLQRQRATDRDGQTVEGIQNET
mmetsp:Transcript_66808/g.186456  ORF Transcript_66808/g.186456 Transcript_66808/m.186456 type:complete len:239 (+) Transcript_66808:3026-3742(+)